MLASDPMNRRELASPLNPVKREMRNERPAGLGSARSVLKPELPTRNLKLELCDFQAVGVLGFELRIEK